MKSEKLISSTYCNLNVQLHKIHQYGLRGDKWVDKVVDLSIQHDAADILDYGCGKGSLKKALATRIIVPVREYDPAITGKKDLPTPADIVVCTDVLEHIEPKYLEAVVTHLHTMTRKILFMVVSTRLAVKTLADGRNAHLIVQPAEVWRPLLVRDMNVLEWRERGDEFVTVLQHA